jgi:DNA sulfur modification protein DndD
MIYFDQLKLNNWISFYGNQPPLVFSKNDDKNITFILADNEVGKTSILRGVQWCMYGKTNDATKYKKHLERLNFQAADELNYSYSVQIKLLFNNQNYIITRSAEIDSNLELSEKNFNEDLICNIEGKIYKDKKAQKEINEIFDLSGSRFYLFDGEMLDEYETLLVSNNVSELSKKIKESIENLLQITPLKHARKSLLNITTAANTDYQDDEKNNTLSRDFAKKIKNIDIDIQSLENQKEAMEVQKIKYIKSLNEANDVLAKNSSDRSQGERLEEIKSKLIPSLKKNIEECEEQLSQLSKTSYLGIVSKISKNNITKLEKEQDILNEKIIKSSKNKLYESLLDDSNISKESRDAIKVYISHSNSEDEDSLSEEIYKIKSTIKSLQRLDSSSSNLGLQLKIYNDLAQARENLLSLNTEKVNLIEAIGIDQSKIINDALNNIKTFSQLIAEINLSLNEQRDGTIASQIKKLEENKAELNSSMPPDLGDKSLSAVKLEISKKYSSFFHNLVEDMVKMSKNDIEVNANRIYQELREFKEIDDNDNDDTDLNLVINDNYGIGVNSGSKELIASAGGSQIVALSLIFSLRNILESQAPILMDTPMARLDNKYRKGLLEVAPNQGTQFILLVHDGEIDPGSELYNIIRPKIGKSYRLNKVNVRHTEILSD